METLLWSVSTEWEEWLSSCQPTSEPSIKPGVIHEWMLPGLTTTETKRKEQPKTRTTIWKETTNNVMCFTLEPFDWSNRRVCVWVRASHSNTLGLAPYETVQWFAASYCRTVSRHIVSTWRVELRRHPVARNGNAVYCKYGHSHYVFHLQIQISWGGKNGCFSLVRVSRKDFTVYIDKWNVMLMDCKAVAGVGSH